MTETPAKDNDRHIIPLLASFYFLHYATLGVVFPLAGYFFRQKGYSGTDIGIFLAIFPLAKFAVTGRWANFFSHTKHRNVFIAVCIFFSSTSLVPLAFFNNRIIIIMVLIVFAMSRTGIIPVMDSIAITLEHKIPYGRMRLFGSLGFIATSISAGSMIDNFGLNYFIWAFMTAGLLSSIPAFLLTYDRPVFRPKSKEEQQVPKDMKLFYTALVLYLTSFAFLSNFLNIRVAAAGMTQTQAGYMWTMGVVSEVVFFFFGAHIVKRVPIRPLIMVSMFMAGLRYLFTGLCDSFTALFLLSALHGFGYGSFHMGVMSYVNKCVPDRLKLKAQTMYSGLGYGLGTITGSVISGIVFDVAGVKMVFITAFLFCTASVIILYLFVKTEVTDACKS